MKNEIVNLLEELKDYSKVLNEENENLLCQIYAVEAHLKDMKCETVEYKINYNHSITWDSQLGHLIVTMDKSSYTTKGLSYENKQFLLKNIPNLLALIKEKFYNLIGDKLKKNEYILDAESEITLNSGVLQPGYIIKEEKKKPGRKKGFKMNGNSRQKHIEELE